MEYIIDNWFLIVASVAVGVAIGLFIKRFISLGNSEKIKTIKEWLLQAVLAAEKEFGSGTGKLKLSTVYAEFCEQLPWLVKLITVDQFSEYVDEALVTMRKMLEDNKAIAEWVAEK